MTLKDFFARFRSAVDDLKDPYLWTDSDLEQYLNQALTELAKKALYFFDTTTWVSLPVTANDPKIAATSANKLDRILHITRARLASDGRKLSVKSMSQADVTAPYKDDYGKILFINSHAWESDSGTPHLVITDYYDDGSLRLGPIPGASDTLTLWAYRLPLDLVSFEVSQGISFGELVKVSDFDHQMTLLQGMKAFAYLKEDPETRDTQLASESRQLFESELLDIKAEVQRQRRPAGLVRYAGY